MSETIETVNTNDLGSQTEDQMNAYEPIYRLILYIPIVVGMIITYIMEYVITVFNVIYDPIYRVWDLLPKV